MRPEIKEPVLEDWVDAMPVAWSIYPSWFWEYWCMRCGKNLQRSRVDFGDDRLLYHKRKCGCECGPLLRYWQRPFRHMTRRIFGIFVGCSKQCRSYF